MSEKQEAQTAELLEALTGAVMWLDLLIEELEIDPDDTAVNVYAVGENGRRELAKVTLAQGLEKYRAAIAKASTPGGQP